MTFSPTLRSPSRRSALDRGQFAFTITDRAEPEQSPFTLLTYRHSDRYSWVKPRGVSDSGPLPRQRWFRGVTPRGCLVLDLLPRRCDGVQIRRVRRQLVDRQAVGGGSVARPRRARRWGRARGLGSGGRAGPAGCGALPETLGNSPRRPPPPPGRGDRPVRRSNRASQRPGRPCACHSKSDDSQAPP
jgi:hypothetical protein